MSSPYSYKLLKAEYLIEKDSVRALSTINNMPKSIISEPLFYLLHDRRCITNVFSYRLEDQIMNREYSNAEQTVRLLIEVVIRSERFHYIDNEKLMFEEKVQGLFNFQKALIMAEANLTIFIGLSLRHRLSHL